MSKEYLGDGAYVEDGVYLGEVVLTTSNGITNTNTIVLGSDEIAMLFRFLERVRAQLRRADLRAVDESGEYQRDQE
jgi:hypothetical protein